MSPLLDSRHVAQTMLSWLDLELISFQELQALWAGYGHICAIQARPAKNETVPPSWQPFCRDGKLHLILKLIAPAGRAGDEGHLRKMLSYEVEQCFYDEIAPRLGPGAAVAQCLASTRSMKERAVADGIDHLTAIMMNDLRLQYPVAGEKRAVLSQRQVHASLDWLSRFHARSWLLLRSTKLDAHVLPPLEEAKKRLLGESVGGGAALWLNGGYTYLATRREEYASLVHDKSSEWHKAFCVVPKAKAKEGSISMSVAEAVALFLTPTGRPFETYIHGDVKSENLFSTDAGDEVAFFDFQYVGLGLGVCDLAKLFTCSVPLSMLTSGGRMPDNLPMGDGEKALLEHYLVSLMSHRPEGVIFEYDWESIVRHWQTALVDWCRFQASWGFWGNTRWLQARVRNILDDESWHNWLQAQVS